MIVSIHQPHFLPWIPYLEKICRADVFIFYDTAQFRKNYYQNRTLIYDRSLSRETWLSLPVKKSPLKTTIKETILVDKFRREDVLDVISRNYKHMDRNFLEEWFNIEIDNYYSLSQVNVALVRNLFNLIGIKKDILLASELIENTKYSNPSDKLVELCSLVGCKQYLSGPNGVNYLEESVFTAANIDIVYFESRYVKAHLKQERKMLSCLEYIFSDSNLQTSIRSLRNHLNGC